MYLMFFDFINKHVLRRLDAKASIKVFFLCLLMTINGASANDYLNGFDAFIKGDYSQAQQFWIKAADKGDAKSMFNLGLMNEQSKLDVASMEKAESWFRKAVSAGYSPAAYHLAQGLLKRGGSEEQATLLIQAAAKQGYAPATRYLNALTKTTRPSQFTSTLAGSGNAAEASTLIKAPKLTKDAKVIDKLGDFQTEAWINNQNSKGWTIQLLAFTQESKVQEFIEAHDLQNKAAYFTEKKDNVLLYKLIYGSFDGKNEATLARKTLSTQLQEYGPWLRQIASIQAIINAK